MREDRNGEHNKQKYTKFGGGGRERDHGSNSYLPLNFNLI